LPCVAGFPKAFRFIDVDERHNLIVERPSECLADSVQKKMLGDALRRIHHQHKNSEMTFYDTRASLATDAWTPFFASGQNRNFRPD